MITSSVKTRILSSGSYLPERRVLNSELSFFVGLDDLQIRKRTGIRQRRWAAKDEAASDLAMHAAEAALASFGCSALSIDAIILSTTSPDMPSMPSTACLVQNRLGSHSAVAFDIAASCGGFLVALSVGQQWIESGKAQHVLVIASEVKSRFLDLHDPDTAILFGDGAGAVLLGRSDSGHQVIDVRFYSDGSKAHLIKLPAGGSRRPPTLETLSQGLHTLVMSGGPIYRAAVRHLESVTREMLVKHNLTISDIQHFIYHQANARILSTLSRRLGIPEDRVVTTIETSGNTSSASLPIAFDVLARSDRVKRGDLIFLAAFGGGLNWGWSLIRW